MIDQTARLQELLEQLDAELKRTPTVGEDQRRQLRALQNDVRALLERSGEPLPEANHPNVQGLQAGLRHFEATHEILSSLIEQVLNTLSGLGI
jgi:hypothetical protein